MCKSRGFHMDNKSCHYHHYLNYFSNICVIYNRLSRWLTGKGYACQCRRYRIFGFNPWVGKITWRRKWQPTLVFLPWKSHGQRSLVGYTPWGQKESDTTEWLHVHIHEMVFLLKEHSHETRVGLKCHHPHAQHRDTRLVCPASALWAPVSSLQMGPFQVWWVLSMPAPFCVKLPSLFQPCRNQII